MPMTYRRTSSFPDVILRACGKFSQQVYLSSVFWSALHNSLRVHTFLFLTSWAWLLGHQTRPRDTTDQSKEAAGSHVAQSFTHLIKKALVSP